MNGSQGPRQKNTTRAATWAAELSQAISSPEKLKRAGFCARVNAEEMTQIKENFDILIPSSFQTHLNLPDSLRRQVEPSREELIFYPEELEDPIGDEAHSPLRGLTHRYPDRVLVKLTHLCGIYCRFCFRRYKVSQGGHQLNRQDLTAIVKYVQEHPAIWEVVLTGGDPFILPDPVLLRALEALRTCSSVRVIRFHTRIPTALPSRITPELVQMMRGLMEASERFPHPCRFWVAAHINAPEELAEDTRAALGRLVDGGIPVIGQSVLLKGVNDSSEALTNLLRGLVQNRVKPYYLHYPDLAQGTEHFRVPLEEAINLYASLRGRLSGLCLPQFILDIPGGKGKIPLQPENLRRSKAHAKGGDVWHALSPLTGEWIPIRYPDRFDGSAQSQS